MNSEGWLQKVTQNYLRKAISKFQLLNDGERVLVGVSGGIDSQVLLHLLKNYNQKKRKNWQILAVHINPGFANWKVEPLIKFFNRHGFHINKLASDLDKEHEIEYKVINQQIDKKDNLANVSMCYFCARQRRKKIFEIAREHQISKIALAHHLEDVNETYLMNLIFNSRTSTFLPKQSFFEDRFFLIRPLYFFDKDLIFKYSKLYGIKPIKNRCPYESTNERMRVRKFLASLYKINPRIKTNIFWGIKNLKNDYLP